MNLYETLDPEDPADMLAIAEQVFCDLPPAARGVVRLQAADLRSELDRRGVTAEMLEEHRDMLIVFLDEIIRPAVGDCKHMISSGFAYNVTAHTLACAALIFDPNTPDPIQETPR